MEKLNYNEVLLDSETNNFLCSNRTTFTTRLANIENNIENKFRISIILTQIDP